MPSPITVAQVLDRSGVLLNAGDITDPLSVFSYNNMMPYMNIALDELAQIMESNNVPFTNEAVQDIVIDVGETTIGDTSDLSTPQLPADLIDIQTMYERQDGVSEDFQFVTRVEFLPPYVEQVEALIYYSWRNQIVYFIGATTPRQIRLNYIGTGLTSVTNTTQQITLFNAQNFLAYRTAALCAHFVGENEERAGALNTNAQTAIDLFLNINTKGRQAIATRRRPFMAGYKVRTGF